MLRRCYRLCFVCGLYRLREIGMMRARSGRCGHCFSLPQSLWRSIVLIYAGYASTLTRIYTEMREHNGLYASKRFKILGCDPPDRSNPWIPSVWLRTGGSPHAFLPWDWDHNEAKHRFQERRNLLHSSARILEAFLRRGKCPSTMWSGGKLRPPETPQRHNAYD